MTNTIAPEKSAKVVKIAAGGVKKGKAAGKKVITANDLFTGGVIYWTVQGTWTDDIAQAQIVEGPDGLEVLAKATADEAHSVGPYLMDVEDNGAPSGRGKLRETIRDQGPTIHPEFGRQAQPGELKRA